MTPGALVTANQTTALTTVQQLDPIHVRRHAVEHRAAAPEARAGQRPRCSAASDDEARIQLLLEDGSAYPHAGRLTFSGVTVDAGTGSVTLRAVVPNPDGLLMPGMYVRAVLQEGVDEQRAAGAAAGRDARARRQRHRRWWSAPTTRSRKRAARRSAAPSATAGRCSTAWRPATA